jgi:hypothetical protein
MQINISFRRLSVRYCDEFLLANNVIVGAPTSRLSGVPARAGGPSNRRDAATHDPINRAPHKVAW